MFLPAGKLKLDQLLILILPSFAATEEGKVQSHFSPWVMIFFQAWSD